MTGVSLPEQVTDQKKERWERAAKLAGEVLDECRVQLMLKFRFLDLALWRMTAEPVPNAGRYALATDGTVVYYEPYGVLARFEQGFDELVRDYLHLVMHCIFRHPWDENHDDADAWWLACDVIAESVALDMCGGRFESELDSDRRAAFGQLKLLCGVFTPAKLYPLFHRAFRAPRGTEADGLSMSRLVEYAALFERDSHEAWPAWAKGDPEDEEPGDAEEIAREDEDAEEGAAPDKQEMQFDNDSQESPDKQQMQDMSDAGDSEEGDEAAPADAADSVSEDAEGADDAQSSDREGSPEDDTAQDQVNDEKSQEEREWEEIAKQIEMNLETFSAEWGEEAGALIASLQVANAKRYDYSDFLRRFTMLSEEMKINDDEYDYIFYTYGLELYGNMPLVEPLEYKETQRIRDFVIAIDTSESCKGELVRRFVEHTFSVMKKQEDFTHAVNVHVVQCDAKVQADTKLTDLNDIDQFMEDFVIRGFGGTDFRPAFAYVDKLRDKGELPELKGMIYFTDGLGQFPDAAPDYDVAFVFMDTGEARVPSVPPWAMRVVIDDEGINKLKSRI